MTCLKRCPEIQHYKCMTVHVHVHVYVITIIVLIIVLIIIDLVHI